MPIKQIEKVIATDYYYNFKSKRLLPIFASCGGDYLAINIDEYNLRKGFKIYYCSPRITNEKNYLSIFDSLLNLLNCILLAYTKTYFFINSNDGILDEEFEKVQELNRELNPLSEYWNSNEII